MVKTIIIGIFLVSCAVLLSANSYAIQYTNAINESAWRAMSSVFECRLEHRVPFYGTAVFRTRAGERSSFYLKPKSSRFAAGEAELRMRSPIWKTQEKNKSLGKVAVKRGMRPLWLGANETEKMLSELNNGYLIEFEREAWYEPPEYPPMTLSISNIGFREKYRRYLACLAGLLPANFDQLKRTALYYPPDIPGDEDPLSPANTRKLDNILKLIKHDNKVRQLYIDGHTSAPAEREYNLELSKRRAEQVRAYLTRRGVPDDWVVLRWHGERYPVATNATAKGRAKNRRVTVRLERIEEIEVLPLASNDTK